MPFKPTLYTSSKRDTANFRSLFHDKLEPVQFGSINDARNFIEKYKDIHGFKVFGNTEYQFQWISEEYKGEVEYDIDAIKVMSIDIETTVNYGFPNYFDPLEEITLISCRDKVTKQITTFGCWPYTPKKDYVKYVQCKDETDLYHKFLSFFAADYPDIITGWNTDEFDIPYMIERMKKVIGEDAVKRLSPFGVLKPRDYEINGKQKREYAIYGVASLDFYQLYLKFAFTKQESYKLDHVAWKELGKNKVENPYASFKDFYTKDPELFIDYNIVDVELVDELEAKRKLIELAISIAYMAKINFDDVYSPVKMWDTIIYNYLLDQNIVVPMKEQAESKSIKGAFVKEARTGFWRWMVSFDLASLYPHIIMALNMSPETIRDSMIDVTVAELLAGDRSKVLDGFSLAPNGSMYDMSHPGFMADLMHKYYGGRKTVKNQMLALKRELEANKANMSSEEIRLAKNAITAKDNLQLALKIAINSAYGAMANAGFRFFDTRIAEGITLAGQLIIQNAINAGNGYLNKLLQNDREKDYVVMGDTDSNYFDMSDFVNKFYPNHTIDETVEFLCKACDDRFAGVLNKACDKLSESMNWNPKLIAFKREAISSTAVVVASKNYAMLVHDNEGVRYKEPDLKVTGLALVRSSTPEVVKEPLRRCIEVILTGDQQTLIDYVAETEKEYMKHPYDVIAFPRGVNNLAKYSSKSSIYQKGCPIHVRASLLYNDLLEQHGLEKAKEMIQEGGKIKFIFLKEPNALRENVIGFVDVIPDEFNLVRYIDYKMMFEKSFIDPLKKVTEAVGWKYQEEASLDSLFD